MTETNYTTINHIARERLGLSWIEYGLADLIYHLSNNPGSRVPGWCYASKPQLAKFLGITERGVYKMLNRLEDLKIIERDPETGHLKITIDWYNTVIIKKGVQEVDTHEQSSGVLQKVHASHEQSSGYPPEQSSYNNDINNKDINNYNTGTGTKTASPSGMKRLQDILERKVVTTPAPTRGISKEWQEKAFRYADKLGIKLALPSEKGRWLKMFKQAGEGRKTSNLEKAYSYLIDHPNQAMTSAGKMQFFFSIYENGLSEGKYPSNYA